MTILSAILARRPACGLYVPEGAVALEPLELLAEQHDLAFFVLDGRQARSKEQFLDHAARVFGFPDYFGKNWDAFADCMTDMSWIDRDGFLILLLDCRYFSEHAADEFGTAVEIFKEAAEFWHKEGKTFLVLLDDTAGQEWALPSISL